MNQRVYLEPFLRSEPSRFQPQFPDLHFANPGERTVDEGVLGGFTKFRGKPNLGSLVPFSSVHYGFSYHTRQSYLKPRDDRMLLVIDGQVREIAEPASPLCKSATARNWAQQADEWILGLNATVRSPTVISRDMVLGFVDTSDLDLPVVEQNPKQYEKFLAEANLFPEDILNIFEDNFRTVGGDETSGRRYVEEYISPFALLSTSGSPVYHVAGCHCIKQVNDPLVVLQSHAIARKKHRCGKCKYVEVFPEGHIYHFYSDCELLRDDLREPELVRFCRRRGCLPCELCGKRFVGLV